MKKISQHNPTRARIHFNIIRYAKGRTPLPLRRERDTETKQKHGSLAGKAGKRRTKGGEGFDGGRGTKEAFIGRRKAEDGRRSEEKREIGKRVPKKNRKYKAKRKGEAPEHGGRRRLAGRWKAGDEKKEAPKNRQRGEEGERKGTGEWAMGDEW